MTNRQVRVCRIVKKYKTLGLILEKAHFKNVGELQDFLAPKSLEFSDYFLNDNSIVTLSNSSIEALEERRRRFVDTWFTRGIAIAALIISIFALLSEIGILKLTQC